MDGALEVPAGAGLPVRDARGPVAPGPSATSSANAPWLCCGASGGRGTAAPADDGGVDAGVAARKEVGEEAGGAATGAGWSRAVGMAPGNVAWPPVTSTDACAGLSRPLVVCSSSDGTDGSAGSDMWYIEWPRVPVCRALPLLASA